MKIPLASDHAGYPAKEFVKTVLQDLGHDPIDYGTHSEDSVDRGRRSADTPIAC